MFLLYGVRFIFAVFIRLPNSYRLKLAVRTMPIIIVHKHYVDLIGYLCFSFQLI